jgi:hypothetical protein
LHGLQQVGWQHGWAGRQRLKKIPASLTPGMARASETKPRVEATKRNMIISFS